MLQNKEPNGNKRFAISPRFESIYKNLKLLSETSSYKVFEGETHHSNEKHTIRVLDRSTMFINKEYNMAATLFVQELLHLQHRYPCSIITNSFDISEDGNQLACATLPCVPLSDYLQESKDIINFKDSVLISKLISDAIEDIEFLRKNMQTKNIMDTLGPQSLYFIKEKGAYFLGNWHKLLEAEAEGGNYVSSLKKLSQEENLTSKELSDEIKALAFTVLSINNNNSKEIKSLQNLEKRDPKVYNSEMKSMIRWLFSDSPKLQGLIERMLSLDPQNQPNLEELRIKENGMKAMPPSELALVTRTKYEAAKDPSSKMKSIKAGNHND